VAPDAGSGRSRRKTAATLLIALLVAVCTACTGTPGHRRDDGPLQPLFSIAGARLIARMDSAGGATFDAIGQYVPLVFPVAVAASLNDIYIADAGASRLYRYDRTLDAMAVLPETRINASTRLQAGADGSVYVLDTFSSEIRRYSRGGQLLPGLHPRLVTSRYSSFTLDPATGKAYVVDSAHLVIDEIQPLGQFSVDLQRLDEAGPIATNGQALFVANSRCGCIVEWLRGRPGRIFGAGQLHQPLSIAVAGLQLYAIDGATRSIALVHEEGVDSLAAAPLGLLMPETLATANGMLLVADGAGHRVVAFRPRTKLPQ
jgi:hypothetical protein